MGHFPQLCFGSANGSKSRNNWANPANMPSFCCVAVLSCTSGGVKLYNFEATNEAQKLQMSTD